LQANFAGYLGMYAGMCLVTFIVVYAAPGQMFALILNYSGDGWYYGIVIAIMAIPAYICVFTVSAILIFVLNQLGGEVFAVIFRCVAALSLCVLLYFSISAINAYKRGFSSGKSGVPLPSFKNVDLLGSKGGKYDTFWGRTGIVFVTVLTNPYIICILASTLILKKDIFIKNLMVNPKGEFGIFHVLMAIIWMFLTIWTILLVIYALYGSVLYFGRQVIGPGFNMIMLIFTSALLLLLAFDMVVKIIYGPTYADIINKASTSGPNLGILFRGVPWVDHVF